MALNISDAEVAGRQVLAAAATRVQRNLARYPAYIEQEDEATRSSARARLDAACVDAAAMRDAASALRHLAGVSEEAIEIAGAAGVAVDVILATLAGLTAQLDFLEATA